MSIRKDLQQLEDEGIAKRVYGGAVLADYALPSSLLSEGSNTDCLSRTQLRGDPRWATDIFLGSGQTCCYLAKLLERFHNLSIVTNNITALSDLLKTDSRVYLLGGEVTSTDAHTLFPVPKIQILLQIMFLFQRHSQAFQALICRPVSPYTLLFPRIFIAICRLSLRSWYLMADHQ